MTTVPAAANAAVALAYGVLDEAVGSVVQLLINLCAIVLAGVLTLLVQRLWWGRVASRRPPGAARPRSGIPLAPRRGSRATGLPESDPTRSETYGR